MEGVLWRFVPWWGRERNWTRILAEGASEVSRAIRQTASLKATGPDEVPAELFKAGGESTRQNAHNMCGNLVNWMFSMFITLRKLQNNCSSRMQAILLWIILERIWVKTETEIADEQVGSRQGRGTKTKSRILEYWCTRHTRISNHCTPCLKKNANDIAHYNFNAH